jgi:putative DNA primase/helicase
LEAAAGYAGRGWPVLPCRGKLPLTTHAVRDASTDLGQIHEWWQRWPDANVAVACGRPGPTVLDVDDPAAYRRLDATRRAQLDEAPTVATARGAHYWLAGVDAGTVALPFGELRSRGSYVVAPPSIHETGREYVWLLEPTGPLPPIPGWLAELAPKRGPILHSDQPLVPVGQRHRALVRFLGLLRSMGFGEQALVAFATAFLDTAVEIDEQRVPLDRDHARRTAIGIARRYPPHPNGRR